MFDKLIIKLFFRILHRDKEYRLAWHDNLAMMAYDAGATHTAANKWAGNFIKILINIDTYEEYKKRNKLTDKELCNRCPYPEQCKATEIPGSAHCFAVLQHRNII